MSLNINPIAHVQGTRQRYDYEGNTPISSKACPRPPAQGTIGGDRQCHTLQAQERCEMAHVACLGTVFRGTAAS